MGGSTTFHNNRAFIEFDLRGVVPNGSKIKSANVKVYRTAGGADGIRVVKTRLEDDNMDSDTTGYGTVLSANIPPLIVETWSNESNGIRGWETIAINNSGLDVLQSALSVPIASSTDVGGLFRVAIITDLDHDNSEPTNNYTDLKISSLSESGEEPTLEVTFNPPKMRGNF